MKTKEKLSPGSYAIIKWSPLEPEKICKVLGYRKGMIIVRASTGEERVLNPKSTQIIRLKEVSDG